jgi:predicted nucleic acid-binding protein
VSAGFIVDASVGFAWVYQGLTIYDATYLELALLRSLPLESRDEALRNAAKQCGLKAP